MKPVTTRSLLLMCGLLACTPVVAQDVDSVDSADSADAARTLDLSVPATPIAFVNAADYQNPPPGGWHGNLPAPGQDGDGAWQVHGSMEVGVGWSEHGGNSNYQAADINMARTYTTDDGDTGHVGINISVGQFDGPAFGPAYGPGYYYGPGPGPGLMSRPMQGPMPGPMPGPFGPGPLRR